MFKKFFTMVLCAYLVDDVSAQERLAPAVKALQHELVQNYENAGYGDHEIDILHKKIAVLIGKLSTQFEKDENGDNRIKLEVTAGESSRPNGDHYINHGYAYLYPDSNLGLKKVVLDYYRQNAGGNRFLLEKRQLVNPSPTFPGDDKLDSNDDISLSLFKQYRPEGNEEKIREIVFKDIDRHDRKMKLLNAYKQYLRKTLNSLENHLHGIELENATELLYMLEFE